MWKRYFDLYLKILSFSLKSELSYRLNYLLKTFYGPAYFVVLLWLVNIAFDKAPQLGGLSKDEGILLYSVFSSLYAVGFVFFIRGFRYFLWSGLRLGVLDFLLTKPVNTQFLVAFSWPTFDQIPLLIGEFALLGHQAWILRDQITLSSLGLFILAQILGIILLYLMLSTYACLGFYVTKAAQIIEILDKSSDFSSYPSTIFPIQISAIMFTVIPIAFFGYVPTLFLINRGNMLLLGGAVILVIIFSWLNRIAWSNGLKHYSSASS
jgi:ABC-2 type transport system permease protein